MSNAWYPKILSRAPLSDLLDSIAGTGDPIKVRLLDDTYTFSAAHDFLNDTTGAIGTDVTLTGSALVEGAWTADDVTWVALASGDTVNAAVLYIATGSSATSNLIGYIDRRADTSLLTVDTNDGNLTLRWPSGLIGRI